MFLRSLPITPLVVACLMGSAGVAAARQPVTPVPDEQRRQAVDRFRSGMEALRTEHYDEAESEFRSAVRLDPQYDAAFYGLGQVYMATHRYEQALRAYLDSREAFKASTAADALDSVAADRRLKDQIEALKDYTRNLQRQVSVNRSPTVTAAIDRNQDQIRELESRLSRNRSLAPPPVPAGLSMALGSAYFRLNQLSDAEREYLAAVSVRPEFGEAHSNLAALYLVTGRIPDAERELQLAEKAGFRVNPRLKADIRAKGGDGGGG